MKKYFLLLLILISNITFAQKLYFGYGTEVNFSKVKFSGTISNSYYSETYSYNLSINKFVTNWSLSSMKLGYLTENNIYFGIHGSTILKSEEGKIVKDNLWKDYIDISDSVYGNGSISYEAKASFKYSRFIGLDLGYNISNLLTIEKKITLISGLGIYYNNIYFGEIIESFRDQYYSSGSQSDFIYIENGKYKVYSKISVSAKLIAMFKYFYLEASIGQVNSLGVGFLVSY